MTKLIEKSRLTQKYHRPIYPPFYRFDLLDFLLQGSKETGVITMRTGTREGETKRRRSGGDTVAEFVVGSCSFLPRIAE